MAISPISASMWGSSAIVCLPYPNKFGHESTSEEEGWDGVFLEEYFTYWGAQGITYDPWLALTSMALRTRRVSLGTTVTPLPSRLPWKLAREAITLDHLSHGRLILGVGLGDAQDRQFGKEIDVKTRASLLRAFDLLKRFVR